MLTVHVVSHTHWDREWYHPAERFRQRLVVLIDELLDDPSANGASFLLDGQTIVLEDYLAVRPERASDLAAALREGLLEAGPWFVLPDELIPSGEGLVRNLLAGRRTLRSLRAEPPAVLYCPDSFGHPAALPALATGFGCPLIILWRGFGGARWPKSDVFWWTAPNGDRALVYHLSPSGYELGANLPSEQDAARTRWTSVREQLTPRSLLETVLLLNGADHHARQTGLPEALRALSSVAAPDDVRTSTLKDFGREIAERASGAKLPEVRGELRDSYGYAWTLQGTLSSRTTQKRRYVRSERVLLRDVEPWTAFAAFYGGSSRRPLTHAMWRSLLLCQPHDTLCGCSIDQVARAMDSRLESVAAQAAGLREDALLEWIGHDRDKARVNGHAWKPTLVVRNRAARPRSGIAIVELTSWVADIPVGPGAAHVPMSKRVLPKLPKLAGASSMQVLARRIDNERIEAPRAYPDNDAVARLQAAVWVGAVPAYGASAFPITAARASTGAVKDSVLVDDGVMTNGRITFRFAEDGALTLEQDGRTLRNFVEWESRTDVGDLYTPAIRKPKLTPRLLNTRLLHRGPLRGTVEQRWRLRDAEQHLDARVRFILDAGASWVRVQISGRNAARDHRLRVRFKTDVDNGLTIADAAFGTVERQPITVSEEDARMERPVPTAPLHRYVSLFNKRLGATLFADGLTEYETESSAIAVTVLRSVGELSRGELRERPGNAGWPAATPEAQSHGYFEGTLSLMLHGPRSSDVVDEIERAADDILVPLIGETLRSALHTPPPVHGVALQGKGLSFSSAKESDSGEWLVLRCVNLLEEQVKGSWRLGRTVREAHTARLDETPLTELKIKDDTVPFVAPPRGIVTVLVK